MITFLDKKSTNIVLKILRKAWLIMERLNTDIIAEMHTGKLKMTREGEIWTDEERDDLIDAYYSGTDITTLAYLHQRTETAIFQQLINTNSIPHYSKPRKTYHTKKECQCYRCSKRGTPECRLCKQCEVNDNV